MRFVEGMHEPYTRTRLPNGFPALRLPDGRMLPFAGGSDGTDPPPPAALTAADVQSIVSKALEGFAAKLPKPAEAPKPAPVAHAAPVADPKLAALAEAYGVDDVDELLALAPTFRDKVAKARDRVADPDKRNLVLEQQRMKAELAQMKAETLAKERAATAQAALAQAVEYAAKAHARNPRHVIAAAQADGRLAIADDGTLFVTAGDGKTPTGEDLAKFLPEYLGKNPHLVAPPATGGPHLTATVPAGAGLPPAKEWTPEDIAKDNAGYWKHLTQIDPAFKQAVRSMVRPSDRGDA